MFNPPSDALPVAEVQKKYGNISDKTNDAAGLKQQGNIPLVLGFLKAHFIR